MKRTEAIGLYNLTREMQSNVLTVEALMRYMPLRVKLKKVVTEFEQLREESKDLPEDKLNEVLEAHLNEECDIDTKVLTASEVAELIKGNDSADYVNEFIFQYFVKD